MVWHLLEKYNSTFLGSLLFCFKSLVMFRLSFLGVLLCVYCLSSKTVGLLAMVVMLY